MAKKLSSFFQLLILFLPFSIGICFVFGIFMTEEQLVQDSYQWSGLTSDETQVHVMDSRDYKDYYFILGQTDDLQMAYLASYKKLPGLPLYRRYIVAANQDRDLTGIGFKLHETFIELLIAPPYTDILIRSETGVLCPAPAEITP